MQQDSGWLGWGIGTHQHLSTWPQALSGFFPTPVSRAEYECFQIELSKNYGMTEWRDDVKKVLFKAGLHNLPITFLFLDTQVPWAVGRVHGGLDTIPSSMASWKVVSPSCPGHCQWGVFWEGWLEPRRRRGYRWAGQSCGTKYSFLELRA